MPLIPTKWAGWFHTSRERVSKPLSPWGQNLWFEKRNQDLRIFIFSYETTLLIPTTLREAAPRLRGGTEFPMPYSQNLYLPGS
jgi:hypothetical protein